MNLQSKKISLRNPDLSDASLSVNNSGFVRLKYVEDPPDGNLAIGEALKNLPIEFKRFYFINSLNHPSAVRGKHAHKVLRQVIFCINGCFTLNLDDGINKQTVVMDNPFIGVQLNGLIWHEMTNFTPDCVILVIAEDYYKEEDYIRDYQEFLRLVQSTKMNKAPAFSK